MKYKIYYRYNNGTTMNEEIEATSAIKALKKVKSYNFLKQVMFQTVSTGTASAYVLTKDGILRNSEPDAKLECSYSCGKWYARYCVD